MFVLKKEIEQFYATEKSISVFFSSDTQISKETPVKISSRVNLHGFFPKIFEQMGLSRIRISQTTLIFFRQFNPISKKFLSNDKSCFKDQITLKLSISTHNSALEHLVF